MMPDTQGRASETPVGAVDNRGEHRRPSHGYLPLLVTTVLVVAANFLAISSHRLPFVAPVLGFWFLVVHPAYLVYTTPVWRATSAPERLGYSITATLLMLMAGGLALNTVLPLVGVDRPLDPVPVVILGDIITVLLVWYRRRHGTPVSWWPALRAGRRETRLIVAGAACVALAVLGANRLNNGAGDQLTLAGLAGMVLTIVFLLYWQRLVREGVIAVVLYLVAAALLLATSLRGWYVTGHDIQQEYLVFQLTDFHGRWNIGYFHNAYNACLSLTILPTELAQVLHVDGPYVYKVFFQLMFAVCPVLVYAIARRYWSRPVADPGRRLLHGVPHLLHGHAVPEPAGDRLPVRVRGHPGYNQHGVEFTPPPRHLPGRGTGGGARALLDCLCVPGCPGGSLVHGDVLRPVQPLAAASAENRAGGAGRPPGQVVGFRGPDDRPGHAFGCRGDRGRLGWPGHRHGNRRGPGCRSCGVGLFRRLEQRQVRRCVVRDPVRQDPQPAGPAQPVPAADDQGPGRRPQGHLLAGCSRWPGTRPPWSTSLPCRPPPSDGCSPTHTSRWGR